MDYLTIIATRSLILFPHHSKPAHHRTLSSSSSGSSASVHTPTASLPDPAPISMAIHNFMASDADCAYFLVTHVLTHPSLYPSSVALGGVSKDVAAEAETMVWMEIDKAKTFIHRLGEWFATHAEWITEDDLEKLALAVGLGWRENADEPVDEYGEVREAMDDVLSSEKYSTHSVHVQEVEDDAVLA
jgi:hypothetical protein